MNNAIVDEIDDYGSGLKTAKRENLIETAYVGSYEPFVGTKGEAYFNLASNSWHYRPFKNKVVKEFGQDKAGFFLEVSANDIDCANDSGWVKGEYLGDKPIHKFGKAVWSEVNEGWLYIPKGVKRQYAIPENQFKIIRDEDY